METWRRHTSVRYRLWEWRFSTYTSSSVSLSRFPQLPLMPLRELAPPDDQTALTCDSLSDVALLWARSSLMSRRHSRAARSPELNAVSCPQSPPKIKLQFRATRSPTTRSTPTSSRNARAHQPPLSMESPEKPYLIWREWNRMGKGAKHLVDTLHEPRWKTVGPGVFMSRRNQPCSRDL
jgi:hypothetical protein